MRRSFLFSALLLTSMPAMAADMQSSAPPARVSAQPAPMHVAVSKTPACDNPFILRDVRRQFSKKERQYWNSTLQIDSFSMIRETAFRPWRNAIIERRFCEADVLLSDARSAKAYYSIAYRTGLAGTNFGTEICVEGADRNQAYAPGCKMAQP